MKRLALLAFLFATSQAWAAFGYYSPISINSAQVPSTQTDFPVLVSVTDARFKTVGNGGHVQNSSGFDIRPYTAFPLTTAITGYELERYNASTGEVIMWVKVSSLSSSTTPFVLAYGDSGISTDGSSTATWSNHFLGVYHLKDGTTLSLTDSTGTHNGINHSSTAATGKIDGAAGFVSASSQYVDLNTAGTSDTAALTYSIWVNGTSFPASFNATISKNPDDVNQADIFVQSDGKVACVVKGFSSLVFYLGGSHTLSTGTWYYLAMTYDNSTGLIGYVNAASDGTGASSGVATTGSANLTLGRDTNNGRYWNGSLDEARYADIVRSADWITTEYNNQSAPGTFETLGSEVAVTTGASGWFYFFP